MHPSYFAFLDEEDGDEKGGGRGGKEEDAEKEEPPVAIPMIGDTKTGPLSLIAGQDNHRREPVKKTRVCRESNRPGNNFCPSLLLLLMSTYSE